MNDLRLSKQMSNKSKRSKELTKKQTLVMDLLKNNKVPLSAYDILDKLHDFGFRAPYKFTEH